MCIKPTVSFHLWNRICSLKDSKLLNCYLLLTFILDYSLILSIFYIKKQIGGLRIKTEMFFGERLQDTLYLHVPIGKMLRRLEIKACEQRIWRRGRRMILKLFALRVEPWSILLRSNNQFGQKCWALLYNNLIKILPQRASLCKVKSKYKAGVGDRYIL